jgi:hypothetical protein
MTARLAAAWASAATPCGSLVKIQPPGGGQQDDGGVGRLAGVGHPGQDTGPLAVAGSDGVHLDRA